MGRKRIYFAADGRLLASLVEPLEQAGLSVATFDGQAALVSRATLDPPDALLMKARLIDGTALEAFTALPPEARVPTIVILSQTQGALRPTLLRAGILDVAMSPIRPRELADQMVEAAGGFKRGDRRVPVSLAVAVDCEGRTVRGVTVDISRSGLGLSLREPVPAGAIVAVRLIGQTRTLEVYGRVLHTPGTADRGKIGVRLIGLSDTEETVLMSLARREEISPVANRVAPAPAPAAAPPATPTTTPVVTSRRKRVTGNGRFLDGSFDLPSMAPRRPAAGVAAPVPPAPAAPPSPPVIAVPAAPPSPPVIATPGTDAAPPTVPERRRSPLAPATANGRNAPAGAGDAPPATAEDVPQGPPTLLFSSRPQPPRSPVVVPLEWHDVDIDGPASAPPSTATRLTDSRPPNWPKGSAVPTADEASARPSAPAVPLVETIARAPFTPFMAAGVGEKPAATAFFEAPAHAPASAAPESPVPSLPFAPPTAPAGPTWDMWRNFALGLGTTAPPAPTIPPPAVRSGEAHTRPDVQAESIQTPPAAREPAAAAPSAPASAEDNWDEETQRVPRTSDAMPAVVPPQAQAALAAPGTGAIATDESTPTSEDVHVAVVAAIADVPTQPPAATIEPPPHGPDAGLPASTVAPSAEPLFTASAPSVHESDPIAPVADDVPAAVPVSQEAAQSVAAGQAPEVEPASDGDLASAAASIREAPAEAHTEIREPSVASVAEVPTAVAAPAASSPLEPVALLSAEPLAAVEPADIAQVVSEAPLVETAPDDPPPPVSAGARASPDAPVAQEEPLTARPTTAEAPPAEVAQDVPRQLEVAGDTTPPAPPEGTDSAPLEGQVQPAVIAENAVAEPESDPVVELPETELVLALADIVLELPADEAAPVEAAPVEVLPPLAESPPATPIDGPSIESTRADSGPAEGAAGTAEPGEVASPASPIRETRPILGGDSEATPAETPSTEEAPTESAPPAALEDAPDKKELSKRLEWPGALPSLEDAVAALQSSRAVLIEWFPDLGLAARQQAVELASLMTDRTQLQTAALRHLSTISEVEWVALDSSSTWGGMIADGGSLADHLRGGVALRFLRAGAAVDGQLLDRHVDVWMAGSEGCVQRAREAGDLRLVELIEGLRAVLVRSEQAGGN